MNPKQLSLELLVEDLPKSLAFYRDTLGFQTEVVFPDVNSVFAQVGKGSVHIKLYIRNEFEDEIPKLEKILMGGSFLIFIEAEGVEEYYKQLADKVVIVKPFHTTDYGSMEFTIEDCNGYLLCFSESVSKK